MGKYTTVQQYQPLRVPPGWGAKERQLVVQLESTFDDIYRRFGRLKLSDLSTPLADTIVTSETNVNLATENIKTLGNRVDVVADDINTVSDRVTVVTKEIGVLADEVAVVARTVELKAGVETVNALEHRLNSAEVLIDGAASKIELKAFQDTVTAMGERLSSAEILIDGANTAIGLKASQSDVDGLTARVSKAEVSIDGANATITLQAGTLDSLGNRLSGAEVVIDGLKESIELNASNITAQADQFSVMSQRIDAQAEAINAKADYVRVEAITTEITGLLKVEELQAKIAALPVISNTSIQSDNVDSTHVECSSIDVNASLYASSATIDNLTIGGSKLNRASLVVVTGIDVKYNLENRISAVQPITTQIYYYT